MQITNSNWLPSGSFQPHRYRAGGVGNWSGHLPFAKDLVVAAQPHLLVELGTHYGESYFGFCQSIAENKVDCLSYAVDNWVGESHAGFYGEDVFQNVWDYNEAHYSSFSRLLRTTFDEALKQFADETIDILHLDGLHTYEAVSHDFHSWFPKVKPGGFILLHDTVARHDDFGVWKVWDELESYGRRFLFHHSWGLGVLEKAGGRTREPGILTALFEGDERQQEHIRHFYSLCADRLEFKFLAEEKAVQRSSASSELSSQPALASAVTVQTTSVLAQVYLQTGDTYSAANSFSRPVQVGPWEKITFDISGTLSGQLRIDPIDCPGVIDIAAIKLSRSIDDEILWEANTRDRLRQLQTGGTLVRLDRDQNVDFCRFLSYGVDPQLFLPALVKTPLDQPLRLDIWVRLHSDFVGLIPLFTEPEPTTSEAPDRIREYAAAQQELEGVRNSLVDERQKAAELQEERDSLLIEKESVLTELHKVRTKIYVLETQLRETKRDLETSRTEFVEAQIALDTLKNTQRDLERRYNGILLSRSWRITAPLRKITESVRK